MAELVAIKPQTTNRVHTPNCGQNDLYFDLKRLLRKYIQTRLSTNMETVSAIIHSLFIFYSLNKFTKVSFTYLELLRLIGSFSPVDNKILSLYTQSALRRFTI